MTDLSSMRSDDAQSGRRDAAQQSLVARLLAKICGNYFFSRRRLFTVKQDDLLECIIERVAARLMRWESKTTIQQSKYFDIENGCWQFWLLHFVPYIIMKLYQSNCHSLISQHVFHILPSIELLWFNFEGLSLFFVWMIIDISKKKQIT